MTPAICLQVAYVDISLLCFQVHAILKDLVHKSINETMVSIKDYFTLVFLEWLEYFAYCFLHGIIRFQTSCTWEFGCELWNESALLEFVVPTKFNGSLSININSNFVFGPKNLSLSTITLYFGQNLPLTNLCRGTLKLDRDLLFMPYSRCLISWMQ